MLYSKQQVLDFLPHRDPFLFVDSIESINHTQLDASCGEIKVRDLVGVEIKGHYETQKTHPIFAGHFPKRPILPGVVQVEMMAQISGFVVHYLYEDITKLDLEVALLSVSSAKFRRPIFPEMKLEVFSECIRARGIMVTNKCKVLHQGEVMSEAEVMASVKI